MGMATPSLPKLPAGPPPAPDAADEAVRNARLMERRRQLGLQGRMSTYLTTAQDGQSFVQANGTTTILGG
jgi:hypothetical protein